MRVAGASSPAPVDFRLYLVTNRHQVQDRPLEERVAECLGAGLRAVQLREKDLSAIELLALARPLRALTREVGARLFINDRLDVALTVGADGIQRGHTSLPVSAIRFVAGDRILIGASVHSLEEAQAAEREGADFLLFGPVYETASKRSFGPPQGLDALSRTVQAVGLPVFAIGGITPERVREVARTGAHGVAVISAILDAEHPARATKAFIDALGSA
ncbi:MAG: thiamine phosphate synthase [Candidatus Methylomirabilia bacterium]